MGGGSPAPAPPPPAPDYSSQFAGLASGQETIRSDIRSAEDTFQDESRDLSREITTGFRDQDDRFDTVDRGIEDLGRDVNTGFSDVSDSLTGLSTDMGNQFDAFGNRMDTGFAGVNENMNTGFGSLSNQVDTRFGELNTGMNTGFETLGSNVNTGFTALGDLVGANDAALLANQQEGFAGVNENVTNVGTNLGNQLTETSSNVLAGQANIADLVQQYGGNLDTYYAALAQGQSEAAARQAALQTGLDSFRSDYDTATTVAQQQRGRIQDAVMGGNTQIQEQLARTADANAQGISNIRGDVSGVQADVQSGNAQATKDFADVARRIATGFDDGSQQSMNLRNEFIDRLNTVRSVLTQQGDQIDENTRQTYSTLVSSFDEQGALIANSVDNMGNRTARALDQQGNLLLAQFNTQGQRVDQTALNINRLMTQMDALGYRPGTNQQMGMMTGAMGNANVYSGLASPYASTR
jgi:hypothetical protein